ncbi:hypothetical protein KP509_04G016800 [Ceratopteris richardii]|uniref:Protein SLOW GREEN 1, chloroplastic n=1 Tax=Ceratopteris richardii TaxID=49495 RepID=A0A8T2UT33_CERRI|nr:hypothetical protein KP509_04G016800 [Ceratopteris richardii]KAH7438482.1 hypothetical protein KP509_04G016800 [Ceratopteris richardii]
MEAHAFAIRLPTQGRHLCSSGEGRLSFPRASPCHLRGFSRVIACHGIVKEPSKGARSLSLPSWPWGRHGSVSCDASTFAWDFSTTGNASLLLRWLTLALYRALLIGGFGLGVLRPTSAYAAAAQASESVVSEPISVAKKTVHETQGTKEVDGKQLDSGLGKEFWKGMELPRGSAELVLKKVLDKDPTDISALECLAKTLIEDDDVSRSLLVIDKLQGLQPDEMEWKYLKAEAYDLDGKANLAKPIFQDILKVDPFSSRALKGLVLAMDQLDEGDAALKLIEDTWNKAKQEKNHEEARNFGILLGQVHTLKGRMEEALQHYQKMIEEDATDFRLYLCQGIIYSVLGELDTAEKMFETFEKLCPIDLPERKFFENLRSRAKKEGQKIFEFQQGGKAKTERNLWKKN